MSNPTKIVQYDLDVTLSKVFDDLKLIQGNYATLKERLMNINVDLFDTDTKEAIQDLLDGKKDSNKLATDRIKKLEETLGDFSAVTGFFSVQKELKDLEDQINALSGSLSTAGEEGTFSEKFTYDPTYGNVTKHAVTGSKTYTVDYTYKDLANGTLDYSEKKYLDGEGKNVTLKKVYIYDPNGNITDINTTTTKV